MKKIVIIIRFLLPSLFIRKFFFKLFTLTLGKGFEIGSLVKEFKHVKQFLGKDVNLLVDVGTNFIATNNVMFSND